MQYFQCLLHVTVCILFLRGREIRACSDESCAFTEDSIEKLGQDEAEDTQLQLLQVGLRHAEAGSRKPAPVAFGSDLTPGLGPVAGLGLGFPHSGSTFTHLVLRRHPDAIVPEKQKETFGLTTEGGCAWNYSKTGEPFSVYYLDACFDGSRPNSNQVLVDISPMYYMEILSPTSHFFERLQDLQQHMQVRFFFVIRNPTEHLISGFSHWKEKNSSLWPDARLNEMIRVGMKAYIAGKTVDQLSDYESELLGDSYPGKFAGKEWVLYLQPWLSRFSADSVLLIDQQRLNETETFDRIFSHIGLRPIPSTELRAMIDDANSDSLDNYMDEPQYKKQLNVSDYLNVDDDNVQMLNSYFAPWNEKLWDLLGTRWMW